MSDTPNPKAKRRIIRAEEKRKRNYYRLLVSPPDGWFRMRRLDLMGLLLEGIVPTPLLSAVDRVQELRKSMRGDDGASIADAYNALQSGDLKNFLELCRRAAVASVVAPRCTHSKREALSNPEVLWVGGISDVSEDNQREERGDLETSELFTIWRAIAGEANIITMSDDDAEEFHSDEPVADDPPVLDGDGVRAKAVDVVSSASPDAAEVFGQVYDTERARIIAH